MSQPEILMSETVSLSLSSFTSHVTEAITRKAFRFESRRYWPAKTVNNYLKTPEEMDAEFRLEASMNTVRKSDCTPIHDLYGKMMENEDGNTNTYGPDVTHSGFMEENY